MEGGIFMNKFKQNQKKLQVYLTQEMYGALEIIATKQKETMSSVARELLSQTIAEESVKKNINPLSDIIYRIVRDVIHAETNRLAKLIIKTMKASAISMYQGTQIIEDMGHNKGQEIFDNSLKMAIAYIKTSYDPNDIPLPAPSFDSRAEAETETYVLTDDDLFEM